MLLSVVGDDDNYAHHFSYMKSVFRFLTCRSFFQPSRLTGSLIWVFLNWVHLCCCLTDWRFENRIDVLVSGLDKVQEVLGGYHYPSALLRKIDSSLKKEHRPTKCFQLLKSVDLCHNLNGFLFFTTHKKKQIQIKNLKPGVPVWFCLFLNPAKPFPIGLGYVPGMFHSKAVQWDRLKSKAPISLSVSVCFFS